MNDPLSSIAKRSKVAVDPSAVLSDYTTFRLGGRCKGLIECQRPGQLESVVSELIKSGEKYILIGGGSNLVVSDEGLDCFVVRYVSAPPLIERKGTCLIASGSTLLDDLAVYAAKAGLGGINYCSGIPGTVGGAVVGNAGAFGKQVGDVTKAVTLLDKNGKRRKALPDTLGFSYRHSALKDTGDVVLSVEFGLFPASSDDLFKERQEIIAIRKEKHPDLAKEPCAGSFFRNIEPTSKAGKRQATGWFLEEAGGKDLRHGGAAIFSKHANIIIKTDGCLAQDVFELSKAMQRIVKEKFDLDLVREVRFVGRFKGMPEGSPDIW